MLSSPSTRAESIGVNSFPSCIVSLSVQSQLAKHWLMESIVNELFCRLQSRQRLVRDMLRGYIEGSLQMAADRLFCACLRFPSGAVYASSHREQPKEACCTSPLEFFGDQRGRLREVLANIVNRTPPSQDFGSLHFNARPAQWSYDGSARRPAGALRIQSARIALPESRVCRFFGRLATKVNRSVFQCLPQPQTSPFRQSSSMSLCIRGDPWCDGW